MRPELSHFKLAGYGITNSGSVAYNPSLDLLSNTETNSSHSGFEVGRVTELGAVAGDTGDSIALNAAEVVNHRWSHHGMNSADFVAFNMADQMQQIERTWYGGKMKTGCSR